MSKRCTERRAAASGHSDDNAAMRTIAASVLAGCIAACGGQAAPAATRQATGSPPAVDVVELSATDASARMAAGTLTSRALTEAYLERIRQIDDAGPTLNAVIEISPTAVADADALDAERKAGKVRSALHGIPILIKDNIDVGRHGELCRLARARLQPADTRCIHRHPAARRRSGNPRKDKPQRVGQLPLDEIDIRMELARGADEESLRARSQSLRIELWNWRRHCGKPCIDRCRNGNRRQHHLPGSRERPRGHQADGRPRQPARDHSHRCVAGHGRPHGANGRRCCDASDRDRRSRRTRSCWRCGGRKHPEALWCAGRRERPRKTDWYLAAGDGFSSGGRCRVQPGCRADAGRRRIDRRHSDSRLQQLG